MVVQNDYGRRELLSQLDPADGPTETMHAILASIDLAGDGFAPAMCLSSCACLLVTASRGHGSVYSSAATLKDKLL